MAKVIFHRVDIAITIKRTEDGGVLAYLSSPHTSRETRLPGKIVQKWLELGPDALLPDLAESLSLTMASPTWREWDDAEILAFVQPMRVVPRLTVNVADLELGALAWERSLLAYIPALYQYSVTLRVSPVLPRVSSIPLTLPLRFLQVNPSQYRVTLRNTIQRVFGTHPQELVARAIQTEACSLPDLDDFRARANWPTAEVLHFDHFPVLDESETALGTANPERPGTLGWLVRLADTWQTRLITIHCENMDQAARVRRLATALVNRGGPAVLVGYFPAGDAEDFYTGFYGNIVHDMPLDASFSSAASRGPNLFLGARRSELLRVSTLGEGLIRLAGELSAPKTDQDRIDNSEIRKMLGRLEADYPQAGRDPDIVLPEIQHYLNRLSDNLGNLVFEFHEGEGLLPLTDVLGNIRNIAGMPPSIRPMIYPPVAKKPKTARPRYVNSHICNWSNGELSRIDQKKARFIVGEIYHLGVQIGSQDKRIRVYGATALLEEFFKWTPEMAGVWLEVGLTGLDFEVLGDPVQELWLPRDGNSETIYFAVVPHTPEVARLRFCVYYKSDLIQSFRLAALTRLPEDENPPLKVRKERLAHTLDLPVESVGDLGYMSRLEYSVTANFDAAPNHPTRAISIVANDFNGSSVITVKGPDLFEIRTNADLPERVERVRATLERISTPPIDGVEPDKWLYGFGTYDHPNAGDEARLKSALARLAAQGWILFDAIVSEDGREQLARTLRDEKRIIHVAHILLDKVIPWAALYDRKYDPKRELDENSKPVGHDVCLAALPDENGQLPVTECGKHPDCLLHPAHCEERRARGEPALLPETVVCPLHFWGFKHIVELPPQQTADQGKNGQRHENEKTGREQQTCICASQPAQMTAGIHARLPLADNHMLELESLVNELAKSAVWKSRASHRDIILNNLKDAALDLIYFYCHASDQDPDEGKVEPYLEFQDQKQAKPGTINASALDYNQPWTHHPLVFLNGCRTAGFSPKALSPFIVKLVQDRGAAGVIGSEISVWEPLASEIALRFLRRFLTGSSAGEALLMARRTLLAKYNPLGLIYTLYSAANLQLDLDGDGKCKPD